MSNRVSIVTTQFTNIREESEPATYGFRMYDDNDQLYNNTWDSIPKTDMEILKRVLEDDSYEVSDMLDFVRDNKTGIYIDGNWYEWNKIKDVITESK
jgi:hypothetical protein